MYKIYIKYYFNLTVNYIIEIFKKMLITIKKMNDPL